MLTILQELVIISPTITIAFMAETLSYLTPKEIQSVMGWVGEFRPLLERYPLLRQVDLVIEGGIGNGQTMPHIARAMFPHQALWVGTDLSSALAAGRGRFYGAIDEKTLRKILETNQHPDLAMSEAIIWANCFDYSLVQDIMRKTGKSFPFLTSFNALPALLDRKLSHYEGKKESGDVYPLDHVVNKDSPYIGQLHVCNRGIWNDEGPTNDIEGAYYDLEEAAQKAGWATERTDLSLLVLRSVI